MSRGYFAIKPIVFHSIDEKKSFLEKNPDYIHIPKRTLYNLLNNYEDNEVFCETCKKLHRLGRIY